jgi:hypothetical protein
LELCWVLRSHLGCALFPILPHVSPIVHSPLPAFPPRICTHRRLRFVLCVIWHNQLPSLGSGSYYKSEGSTICRSWSKRTCCGGNFHSCVDRNVRLHGPVDLWHPWVCFFMITEFIKLISHFNRLTGEQVNAHRLLSSWTLHFAAKKSSEVIL